MSATKTKSKKNTVKRVFGIIAVVFMSLILVVMTYVAYVALSYSRIDDRQSLTVSGAGSSAALATGTEYTVVTQNVGFGAYTRDFTFFMDGGTQSWANSKESVIDCIAAASETARSFSPDFVLFQEVDTNSTRSYHTDQRKLLDADFTTYSSVGAVNYHSAFLFWPLYQPHGICNSQIVTYSSYAITSSVRRSLPISTGFSKLLDLDRCYSVSRIQVEGGKELVLYNVHLSAYGSDDSIRTAQMTMLFEDMQSEYEAGNYCVCGGDFNHDFTGTSTQDLNGGSTVDFGWAQPFPDDLLSQYAGVNKCVSYDGGLIKPTCRNCDVGYTEGNFTIIVDGFLVSANVSVSSLNNIVTGFEYSDHNPVVMKFSLN